MSTKYFREVNENRKKGMSDSESDEVQEQREKRKKPNQKDYRAKQKNAVLSLTAERDTLQAENQRLRDELEGKRGKRQDTAFALLLNEISRRDKHRERERLHDEKLHDDKLAEFGRERDTKMQALFEEMNADMDKKLERLRKELITDIKLAS